MFFIAHSNREATCVLGGDARAHGQRQDADTDGIPDYLEDINGNGVVDSGESDWQNAGDGGLRVFITRPRENSVLP